MAPGAGHARRARRLGLAPPVVVADAGYGNNGDFRAGIAERGWSYLVQVENDLSAHRAGAIPELIAYLGLGPRPKPRYRSKPDAEALLAFYDFPAEHWRHLKTSNPIESTFATVRLRTKVTKGSGSRAAELAMVFKLLKAAQEHWRYVNAAHLVALVRAGAKFEKGVLVERPKQAATKDAA